MSYRQSWTKERIVAACQAWAEQTGAAPTASCWARGTAQHPSQTTAIRYFGSWNRMLVAAGFPARQAGTPPLWTQAAIIAAAHAWHAQHGESPRYVEWLYATPATPPASACQRVFGSWNRMLEAAGLPTRTQRPPIRWTHDLIADALLDWLFAHGRWPRGHEWEGGSGPQHPNRETVLKRFGSWNAALTYAGAVDRSRHKSGRRTTRPAPPLVVCAGCGTEPDNHTLGCQQCNERHRSKRRRVAAAQRGLAAPDASPARREPATLSSGGEREAA